MSGRSDRADGCSPVTAAVEGTGGGGMPRRGGEWWGDAAP
jgi:hypothetical protein